MHDGCERGAPFDWFRLEEGEATAEQVDELAESGVVEPGVPADEFTGCLDLQTMTIAYIKDYI